MLARLLGRWFDSALAILGRHPPLARRLLGALVAYLRLTPIRLGQRSLLAFCTRSLLPTLPPFDDAVVPLRACEAVRLRCFQLGGSHKADILSEWLLLTGVWQPALTSYLLRALSPGDTLIDVGANTGYFALLAAAVVGERGGVVAVEASSASDPDKALRKGLGMNDTLFFIYTSGTTGLPKAAIVKVDEEAAQKPTWKPNYSDLVSRTETYFTPS